MIKKVFSIFFGGQKKNKADDFKVFYVKRERVMKKSILRAVYIIVLIYAVMLVIGKTDSELKNLYGFKNQFYEIQLFLKKMMDESEKEILAQKLKAEVEKSNSTTVVRYPNSKEIGISDGNFVFLKYGLDLKNHYINENILNEYYPSFAQQYSTFELTDFSKTPFKYDKEFVLTEISAKKMPVHITTDWEQIDELKNILSENFQLDISSKNSNPSIAQIIGEVFSSLKKVGAILIIPIVLYHVYEMNVRLHRNKSHIILEWCVFLGLTALILTYLKMDIKYIFIAIIVKIVDELIFKYKKHGAIDRKIIVIPTAIVLVAFLFLFTPQLKTWANVEKLKNENVVKMEMYYEKYPTMALEESDNEILEALVLRGLSFSDRENESFIVTNNKDKAITSFLGEGKVVSYEEYENLKTPTAQKVSANMYFKNPSKEDVATLMNMFLKYDIDLIPKQMNLNVRGFDVAAFVAFYVCFIILCLGIMLDKKSNTVKN